MNSILTTRKRSILIIVLIFCFYFSQGQEQKQSTNHKSEETLASEQNENQRLMTFSFALFNPITTKNSYIGQGTEGTLSYKLGTQVFIYKQFFVGAYIGATNLDVVDQAFTGNYKKSRISDFYFEFGYEAILTKKLRLGLSITPFGDVTYRNKYIIESTDIEQKDHGKRFMFNSYLNYNITKTIGLFLDYSFRNDKMRIKAPSSLQSDFKNIQYHNIGIGIKFYLGDIDVISSL